VVFSSITRRERPSATRVAVSGATTISHFEKGSGCKMTGVILIYAQISMREGIIFFWMSEDLRMRQAVKKSMKEK